MTPSDGIRRLFRLALASRSRSAHREVDDELRFHIESRVAELVARGHARADAEREARREFGDVGAARAELTTIDRRRLRRVERGEWWGGWAQDVRYAVRGLARQPGFTAAVLLTVALGVGANGAVFSAADAALLRPLPYREPERLVHLWQTSTSALSVKNDLSYPNFLDWRARSRSFSGLAGYHTNRMVLIRGDQPRVLWTAKTSANFFDVLGARPALGRLFAPGEDAVGAGRVAVLSHELWTREFAGDARVVGSAVNLDGAPYTVVGVLPRHFQFARAGVADAWVPIDRAADMRERRRTSWMNVIGRLAPGATLEGAQAELDAIARDLAREFPDANADRGALVVPLREELTGAVRPLLLVVLGAAGCVLLVGLANVASLLLVRGTARQQELGVRAALGAGRGRIVRQLLTESVVLALAGGALGVALAVGGVRALGALGAAELPRASAIRVDGAVLLYALAISTAAGLLFGLLPALRATSANLQSMLRAGARGSVGDAGQRLRSTLVVAEVALAAVLVVGAGLAAKSFARLLDVDPGFQPQNVLTVRLSLTDRYSDEQRPAYYEALLARIAAVPGVQAVGAAKNLPLRGMGEDRSPVIVPGTAGGAGDRALRVPLLHVSADYFRAMGIPLRAGRAFTAADRADAPTVWIVNEAFARRHFPGASPVGRTLQLGEGSMQVIGVVGDVRQRSLTQPAEPMAFTHYPQNPRSGLSFAIRTAGDPLRSANAVREAIWSLDRDQTITSVETMSSIVGGTVARPRLLASLLLLFGTMGLLLGALGIYGVLAFTVTQRRQEIGVRVALGASPRSVLALVVRQGMLLALGGVVVGIAGAALLTRVMSAVLYEVRATDPTTFATVIVVLLSAALLASWLPARRAVRVDPVQALRYD